jgi:ABC-type antimicrobial peptide transport system permease subunit
VFEVRTMDDIVARQMAPQRLLATLLAGFAGLALVLAATGVYGVTAYVTRQRTREVGIRIALGAQRADVLVSLLRESVTLVVVGVVVGLALTIPLGRLMRGVLTDVAPSDPTALAGAALVLLIATLVACVIPASRATRISPVRALRGD